MNYERSIVVLFNQASKDANDPVLARIFAWPEVEGTKYNNDDGGAATVTVEDPNQAAAVADRIKMMPGVLQAFVPPCGPVG